MAKGIQANLKIADADPNETCEARLFNRLAGFIRRNTSVVIRGALANQSFWWTSAEDPPPQYQGIPRWQVDGNGNVTDIQFFYEGEYRNLIGFDECTKILKDPNCGSLDDPPWTPELDGSGNQITITASDGTNYVLCCYTGHTP